MNTNLLINTTTLSINNSTGALIVSGGGGFNGNIYANNLYTYLGSTTPSLASPSPVTTKGDIYVYSNQNDRLPASTNGSVLISDSTTNTGLRWISTNLLYGADYNFIGNMFSSASTNTSFYLKTSLTTGTLSGGTYCIQIGYYINPNTSNSQNFEIAAYINATNTTGTLIYSNINRPYQLNMNLPYFDSITQTIGSSIANVGLWYRTQNVGSTVNISNARITLFKIQ